MSLFSRLFQTRRFSFPEVVATHGLEQFAAAMAIVVRAKFSLNPMTRAKQVRQFLREEADAMHSAGGYPAKVARELFDDPAEYIGAMKEEAEYPIDYPGAPQQILLQMTLEYMRQTNDQNDPVKFRCAVVKNIALIEPLLIRGAMEPGSVDPQILAQIQKEIDEADELLGKLIKKYRGYFEQFMGN